MTILDVFDKLGNYGAWVRVMDITDKGYTETKPMKVGNINYKQINRWMYKREVYQICPYEDRGRKILLIKLMKEN